MEQKPGSDEIRKLLYECIKELEYVQLAKDGCGSGTCASSKGQELIEKGMKLLGVSDLSAETIE